MKIRRFIAGFIALMIMLCSALTVNLVTLLTGDEAIGGIGGVFINAILAWVIYRLIVGKEGSKFKSFRLTK